MTCNFNPSGYYRPQQKLTVRILLKVSRQIQRSVMLKVNVLWGPRHVHKNPRRFQRISTRPLSHESRTRNIETRSSFRKPQICPSTYYFYVCGTMLIGRFFFANVSELESIAAAVGAGSGGKCHGAARCGVIVTNDGLLSHMFRFFEACYSDKGRRVAEENANTRNIL